MDMNRFNQRQEAVAANAGFEFGDLPKVVVAQGAIIRLVGDFDNVWEHFVEMPTGKRPYYCGGPAEECPLCAAAAQLCISEDKQKQAVGKDIKAKERYYFNVLDRSPTGRLWHAKEKKTKLLSQNEKGNSIGSQLFQAIGAIVAMRRQQGQNEDPNTFDIMLSKTGTSMSTKYGAQFTGAIDPLTEEELAYQHWPLDQIAKQSPHAEREVIARFLLGEGPPPEKKTDNSAEVREGDIPFDNPTASAGVAKGPVQVAAQATTAARTTAAPVAAPPPAKPPGQAMKPIAQPMSQRIATQPPPVATKTVVAPPPPMAAKPAPAKLVVKPQVSEYQDTKLREGVDMSTNMTVPCSECSAEMMINMEDQRDLKCHACGKVYLHPNKG